MKYISNKTNYLLTLSSSFAITLISTFIGIISVPISLSYWQTEKYGIWALLTSLIVYLNMTNLGLNSAATTLISKTPNSLQKLIVFKKSLMVIASCALLFGGAFVVLNITGLSYVDILGKIPKNLINETQKALFIMGVFFFINMPFSLLSSIIVGFQMAYVENLFSLVQLIFNFVSLLAIIYMKGDLITYALLNGVALFAMNILRTFYFYMFIYKKLDQKDCNIILCDNDEISYSNILLTSKRFFFIGIAAMLVWNADYFVISYYLGVSDVTPYSVILKYYTILYSLIFMVNSSVMPLLAKEYGTGNWAWINKVYSTLLVLSAIIGGLTWLAGIFFAKDFIKLWTGDSSRYAGLITALALGGYSYLLAMVNLNSGVIATFNFTKHGPWAAWLEAVLKIGFSVMLLKLFGIGGVAIGTFLGSLLAPTWILPLWLVRRSNHKLTYNINFILKHFFIVLLPSLLIGVLTQNYIDSSWLRIIIGCASITVYLWISLYIMPIHTRKYFKEHLSSTVAKLISYRLSFANKYAKS